MISLVTVLCLWALSIEGNAAAVEETSLLGDQQYQKQVLDEAKSWLVESMKSLKDDVQKSVDEVRTLQTTLKNQGQSEIQQRYSVSKDHISQMAVPPECLSVGLTQLQELEASSINSFFLCPNLTLATQDVVGIGFEAAKLTSQLLLTADELINGFGSCWSWNPFKFVYCSFVWMKRSFADSFRSIGQIRSFTGKVASLIADIKAQYNYCTNQSKGQADVHTVTVLQKVHDCTLKRASGETSQGLN